jgi:hypothetical protein
MKLKRPSRRNSANRNRPQLVDVPLLGLPSPHTPTVTAMGKGASCSKQPSARNARSCLINPETVEMPRMRPAIKAGLMQIVEAAMPYMRQLLVVTTRPMK